ncbi:transcriptional regulator GlxA family with amidase domain [Paraburkholderia bannensis]|uniref:Transcriptional regulator GlxA family with amidase domain n=1 Tax=Paraburkholderia bannensis TaxID=765414 RepID=A0A7W9U1Q1_9BURK|nr:MULTISPECIES: DJ-1/PfpI family protein [Paraburkholderia]MBB3260088.1 transcriptional regulator GlxA family with amidase domain [Paraburkholderia sp. WP4_3_2]MBB6105294.1 transcriptional regulator GlxA family with amidase domain [Paraburkholderia bannensis]
MQVAMMLYAGFQLLEVSDAMDVFHEANRLHEQAFYEPHLLGPSCGNVLASSGAALATADCYAHATSAFDIVVVPGSPLAEMTPDRRQVVEWLRHAGAATPRIASLSGGALLVARAGLADRHWITTDRRYVKRLADEFPSTHAFASEACLKDGKLYSSGSARAGLHLALALVREDLGAQTADRIGASLGLQLSAAKALPRVRTH